MTPRCPAAILNRMIQWPTALHTSSPIPLLLGRRPTSNAPRFTHANGEQFSTDVATVDVTTVDDAGGTWWNTVGYPWW